MAAIPDVRYFSHAAQISPDIIMSTTRIIKMENDSISSDYTDCTVRCGSIEYKAHRAVLAQQCDFFSEAFKNGTQEANFGIIDLSDHHPSGVRAIMEYFYAGAFKMPMFLIETDRERCFVVWHYYIEAYIAAEKYKLPQLKDQIRRSCALDDHITKWTYRDIVKLIYERPSNDCDGLKEAICAYTLKNFNTLKEDKFFLDFLKQNAALAAEVLMLAHFDGPKTYCYSSCIVEKIERGVYSCPICHKQYHCEETD